MAIRVISAVIAGFSLLGIGMYFGVQGLSYASYFLISIGVFEFNKMVFKDFTLPPFLKWGYPLLLIACILLSGHLDRFSALFFPTGLSLFVVAAIWSTRNTFEIDALYKLLSLGFLGFLYAGIFPFLAIQTLNLDQGVHWFVLLLLIVFGGDVSAYFGGKKFGKNKLAPKLSPKKTVEGAISGLIGCVIIGVIYQQLYLDFIPTWYFVILALLTSLCAQSGDFFESLIKRIAGVKDSGRIMPGHGGALDRLDGVYFSGPVFYSMALFGQILFLS